MISLDSICTWTRARWVTYFALGLAAMLVVDAGAKAAEPLIPIGAFARGEQFGAPVLSPDGEHMVVNRRIEIDGRDVTVMVVYSLADMKPTATVRPARFEIPIGYEWVTNRRLAVIGGIESGTLEPPLATGEVYAMDLDGQHQEYLYGYKPGVRRMSVMVSDEGWGWIAHVPASLNGHLFLTENLYGVKERNSLLYDVDTVTARRRLVAEIGMKDFSFLVQHDDKPRFAYGSATDSVDLAVFRRDDAKGQWKEIAGSDKANLLPIAISGDDLEFIATVGEDGGARKLVRQSLADDKRATLAEDTVGSIDMFEWTAYPSIPFAAATAVGTPKLRYLDNSRAEAQLHRTLSAQFPGSYVHFASFSRDGSKLIFLVQSDRDPGAYYLFDRAANRATLLLERRPWIKPEQMAERRAVAFKAGDAVELHGYLTLPAARRDGVKPPLILVPHGGPHGVADDWFFDNEAQFLASRGYAVLQVNYRGSDGRGMAFRRAGYRQWGGRIQDDLADGVRWAVAQGLVDGTRACVYGSSFGAYSAMMMSIRFPGMFKCAVGYAGIYDLAQLYEDEEIRFSKQGTNYLSEAIGRDAGELAANSPARLADKLTIPVLLVHGGEDKRAPPVHARLMRTALTKAGRPPEWMYVEGEGHGFYAEKSRVAFYEQLEAFLGKYLGK